MQKLKDVAVALAIEVLSWLLAPVVPLVAVIGYRQRRYLFTSAVYVGGEGGDTLYVDRWALPSWLWWFQTPDEPMPGALYEPTVRRWLQWGPRYTAARWMLRNRLYGLSWKFGRSATGYLDPVPGKVVERNGLWRVLFAAGPVSLGAGWKVHRAGFGSHWQAGPFWAIPFVQIKLRMK